MHAGCAWLCPWHTARGDLRGNSPNLHLWRRIWRLQRRLFLLQVLLLRQRSTEIRRRRHLRELRMHLWRDMPLRLRLLGMRVEGPESQGR